jgi:hypothetical protein
MEVLMQMLPIAIAIGSESDYHPQPNYKVMDETQ